MSFGMAWIQFQRVRAQNQMSNVWLPSCMVLATLLGTPE